MYPVHVVFFDQYLLLSVESFNAICRGLDCERPLFVYCRHELVASHVITATT